jgi:hypothetical protein
MYLSLPEISRDSFTTFKQRCAKCAKKGFYLVRANMELNRPTGNSRPDYWEDFNSSYNDHNLKPLARSDIASSDLVTTGKFHMCHVNELESHRGRKIPYNLTKGVVCRENFETHYWRKAITEWARPLEDQIVITAVVTVRASGKNAGFPEEANFELGDANVLHNRLYTFMYVEFVNQKKLTNMLLAGITNHLIYHKTITLTSFYFKY